MTSPLRGAAGKVLTRPELMSLRAAARAQGRAVVQCHGCFDIVHPGHIRHLKYARALGDILLVTLTGDAEMHKGLGRPLIPEELRAENLAALDCVDWVFVEERPTAAELLDEVRPDVYIKGREYEFNSDPRFAAERNAVERHGGRVVFSSGDVVFSSTALISAIERSADPFHARLTQLLARPELQGPAIGATVNSFRGKRVLIVGETVLDTYVLCDRPDVAGESPVMTLRPVERRHYDGGAAIIARHIAAMGGRPVLVTAMPPGAAAEALRVRLLSEGVDVRPFDVTTPLPEKQRFLVGAQKVMKVDLVQPLVLDAAQQARLVGLCAEAAADEGGCHGAIIADFAQGLFTDRVLFDLTGALRGKVGVMAGDVSGRRASLRAMRTMDLLCPSESELREAFGLYDEGLPTVTWKLLHETGGRAAMITMGAEGLIAFDRRTDADGSGDDRYRSRLEAEHVPAMCPYAIDALGCGDSLLSAATLSLCAGADLLTAAFIGSVAAAVQAQRIGNIPVTAADLRQGAMRVHAARLAFSPGEVVGRPARANSLSSGAEPAALQAS